MHRAATLRAQVGPRDEGNIRGPDEDHMEVVVLLSLPTFTLPPFVAACQSLGVLGSLVGITAAVLSFVAGEHR